MTTSTPTTAPIERLKLWCPDCQGLEPVHVLPGLPLHRFGGLLWMIRCDACGGTMGGWGL